MTDEDRVVPEAAGLGGFGVRLSWYRGERLFRNGITWFRVMVSWRRREHDIGGLWWDQRRKRVRILRPNGKAVTA